MWHKLKTRTKLIHYTREQLTGWFLELKRVNILILKIRERETGRETEN